MDKLASILYPDFECLFYIYKETIPENIVIKLNSYLIQKLYLN